MNVAIVGADVLDGSGSPAIPAAVVVVDGSTISAVGTAREVDVPPDATVIDASGTTIMPGLINTHDHLSAPDPEDPLVDHAAEIKLRMTSSPAYRLTFALRYGEQELLDGVTTIRILGERDGLDASYRDAFDRDLVPGPRIITSGPAIITSAQYHATAISVVADGADGVRAAVRRNILNDAKVIKLIVSGGRKAGVPRNMTVSHFTQEEISAAVSEAHKFDVKVTAHLNGGAGVDQVLDAGIDGIEHGMEMSDRELDRAVAAGTVIGMTMLWHVTDVYRKALGAGQRAALEAYVRRLHAAGARMTIGNDHCHQGHGIARQMMLLQEFGIPPMRVIQTATSEAAVACGVDQQRGTLRIGMDADLIAVGGNPLEDMSAMTDVRLVMKGGTTTVGLDRPWTRGIDGDDISDPDRTDRPPPDALQAPSGRRLRARPHQGVAGSPNRSPAGAVQVVSVAPDPCADTRPSRGRRDGHAGPYRSCSARTANACRQERPWTGGSGATPVPRRRGHPRPARRPGRGTSLVQGGGIGA